MYKIALSLNSDEAEKLFKLVSQFIRSDYYVNILVNIAYAYDKKSSYLRFYELDSLTIIDNLYEIEQFIKFDLFNKYIF